MGGAYYPKNTEKAKKGSGVSQGGFSLRYNTMQVLIHSALTVIQQFISNRWACSIPDNDKDEVIITGGSETLKTVSVYSGSFVIWRRDLTSLNQARNKEQLKNLVTSKTKQTCTTQIEA